MTTPMPSGTFPGTKQTTLGEQGKQLPVGQLINGKLDKSFSLRPFRLKEEKALQKLKDDYPQMVMTRYATLILAQMVASVGGQDFDKLEPAQRQLALKQMFMADFMYMYVYLRRESMGKDMNINLICPKCKAKYAWTADLDTLDISTIEDLAALKRDATLETGFPLRGKDIKKVTTEPVRWSALDGQSTIDQSQVKSLVIQNSIIGCDGIPPDQMAPIPDAVLDELTKRDAERLVAHINQTAPGVKMIIEAVHELNSDGSKGCGAALFHALDWSYDSFFGSSSL